MRCPAGRTLRGSHRQKGSWVFRARAADCRTCALRSRCFAPSAGSRTVAIVDGYEALLRARRRRLRWGEREHGLYARHRWRVEGAHAEAKTRHGLRRAVRRGLWNVAIQVYLTAAAMNLKRLAMALVRLYFLWFRPCPAIKRSSDPLQKLFGGAFLDQENPVAEAGY